MFGNLLVNLTVLPLIGVLVLLLVPSKHSKMLKLVDLNFFSLPPIGSLFFSSCFRYFRFSTVLYYYYYYCCLSRMFIIQYHVLFRRKEFNLNFFLMKIKSIIDRNLRFIFDLFGLAGRYFMLADSIGETIFIDDFYEVLTLNLFFDFFLFWLSFYLFGRILGGWPFIFASLKDPNIFKRRIANGYIVLLAGAINQRTIPLNYIFFFVL